MKPFVSLRFNRGALVMLHTFKMFAVALTITGPVGSIAFAKSLKIGDVAPAVQLKNQNGEIFTLQTQKGKRWTILYFYPKAGTPGCTKQACAFRDAADKIRASGAEVYGVSTDSVEKLAAFHKEHRLTFPLLSDVDAKVTESFGVKFPIVKIAKRWTFIIDPKLKIRHINDNVDPLLDAKQMLAVIENLKKEE
jgi:peroxiredoxin Q/BCP